MVAKFIQLLHYTRLRSEEFVVYIDQAEGSIETKIFDNQSRWLYIG